MTIFVIVVGALALVIAGFILGVAAAMSAVAATKYELRGER